MPNPRPRNPVGAAAAPADEAQVDTTNQAAPAKPAVAAVTYSASDKQKIKKLTALEIELDGTESSEVLTTLLDAAQAKDAEEDTERTEIPGLPDKLPVQSITEMIGGKPVAVPQHFVAAGKGAWGIYNEHGVRIDVAFDQAGVSSLNKKCARVNALRRVNRIPGEL